MDPVTRNVLLGIGCVAALILTILYLKSRKGRISIIVDGSVFREGDTVKGRVEVRAHQPIRANMLTLHLVCRYRTRSRGKNSGPTELVHEKTHLLGTHSFRQGALETFPFSVSLPAVAPLIEQQSQMLVDAMPDLLKGLAKAAASSHKHNLDLAWHLSAVLDAEGLDLESSIPLPVNRAT